MAKEVRHVFKVEQSEGAMSYMSFPIDMLRHDRCHPVTEQDSANISSSFNLGRKQSHVGQINLRRYAHKNWIPTKDRWLSFGWEVVAQGYID